MKKAGKSEKTTLPSDNASGNAGGVEAALPPLGSTIGELVRKAGGAKTSRSETVTVRLDPKTRYLAEIAARKQYKTLSSFMEWAVAKSFDSIVLHHIYHTDDHENDEEVITLSDLAPKLWDVDPAERFVRLAILEPHLLTHDEQILWKNIRDSGLLKPALLHRRADGTFFEREKPDWNWLEHVGFPLLRDHWETFENISTGQLNRSQLPKFE
ncbi:hypothetical protein EGT07_10235 [Herbaspirillum sp. HC18]|nr:hypothetical protein EGT07_10235 [Herbaspirillum sp. HC18]